MLKGGSTFQHLALACPERRRRRRRRGEPSQKRQTHRNGYRNRQWQTPAGAVDLQARKLRQGSYVPSFLAPRRATEKALVAVIQEAYVHGIPTRAVDDLVHHATGRNPADLTDCVQLRR